MIAAQRDRVEVPRSLSSGSARAARGAATRHFRAARKQRGQRAFVFDANAYGAEDVRAALDALFHGKCAYCESNVTLVGPLEVDHFRPLAGALNLDGSFSPDHYWWLAYDWENLYPACGDCLRMKGQRFPIERRRRVSAPTRGAGLHDELPLLLDPCRDDPAAQLVFLDDGTVASDERQARTTIDVLGLNRPGLVEARYAAVEQVKAVWNRMEGQLGSEPTEESAIAFEMLFDAAHEYAGLRRQFLTRWAYARRRQVDEFLAATEAGPSSLADVVGDANVVTKKARKEVSDHFMAYQVAQGSYSINDESTRTDYFARTRWLERIEIRNLKAIQSLTLDFPPGSDEQTTPWLMLLGENGTGKSTILRGIALALIDDELRRALCERYGVKARDYVTHGRQSGSVTLTLSGSPEPVELRFSRRSNRFEGTTGLKQVVLGYGATRLLPGRQVVPPMTPGRRLARVENLFSPFEPLGDATKWLLSLSDKDFETDVAVQLRGLLKLEGRVRLIRNRRKHQVEVEEHGTRSSLEELSDGYQSVVALAADIMRVVRRSWPVVRAAEGIVLLDELGSHLHPRWRMRIVEALRTVFPRMQFVVSSHDPLCLRGLDAGEVAVMRRRDVDDRIMAVTEDLPPPSTMRVDQLLASEYFGLGSTVEPALDHLFAEYYSLKAKPSPTMAESARINELAEELHGRETPWTTRRERLVYEAADQFLATELDLPEASERRELRDDTKRKIAEIWAEAGS